jgi:hypothetical protein
MLEKNNSDKEYRKLLKEMGYEKSEDEPLTEQEMRQIFIYNKILEGQKSRLEVLNAKIEELSKIINEKKTYTKDKIKKSPIAYVAGAFFGGLFFGYLIGKRKDVTDRSKEKDET